MNYRHILQEKTSLAILVGGRSLRFGADKGLFCRNGSSLIGAGIRRLAPAASEILIVAHDSRQARLYREHLAADLDLEKYMSEIGESAYSVVQDTDREQDLRAPLIAIATALRLAKNPWLACVPVDAVGVLASDIALLSTAISTETAARPAAAYFADDEGQILPFPCLLHRPEALAVFSRAIAINQLSVCAALSRLTPVVRPKLDSFAAVRVAKNANTRDAL